MDTKSLQLACKPLIYTAEQSDFEALGHLVADRKVLDEVFFGFYHAS